MWDGELEEDKDGFYALRRVPGRFYVSKRFAYGSGLGATGGPPTRFAWQVFDSLGAVAFEGEGFECVVRETKTRQQLRATFIEDSGGIDQLVLQRFNAEGKAIGGTGYSFRGQELADLIRFLAVVMSRDAELIEGDDGVRLDAQAVGHLLKDEVTRHRTYARYRSALLELYKADVSAPEVTAVARRRQQIERFDALLSDERAFEGERRRLAEKGKASGAEAVWQRFFEENRWIFGSGLATQFLHSWDLDRLEQTVVGSSIGGPGKRPDAVMYTAGALRALALVEIKAHTTPLLASASYRPGTWAVSSEIAGGISQCQVTVDATVRRLAPKLMSLDAEGYETDTTFVCRPRSILVAGSLGSFKSDSGQIQTSKFESFERLRRSLRDPEIVTFDELYQRARMIHLLET